MDDIDRAAVASDALPMTWTGQRTTEAFARNLLCKCGMRTSFARNPFSASHADPSSA